MRVLLISPTCMKLPVERYGGVESVLWDFAEVLPKLGVETTLAAPKGSKAPEGVELIETVDLRFHKGFGAPEIMAYEWYRNRIKEFDCIHDFSHSKHASMVDPSLPSISICWFEPVWFTEQRGGKLHPMPHNIVCLSKYQRERFKLVYKHEAKHQPTICRNPDEYAYCGDKGDRFLFVGKMSWHKGCLEALKFCKELGVPLDVCGGFGVGDPPYYKEQVISECDDENYCFYPNVTNNVKIKLMQHAKAVLYPVQFTESHNMVLVESMLCGTPVVAFNKGAMSEVVEHGVTGFVANSDDEFKTYMGKVGELEPKTIRKRALKQYSREIVVKNYLNLYNQVIRGLKW